MNIGIYCESLIIERIDVGPSQPTLVFYSDLSSKATKSVTVFYHLDCQMMNITR